MKELFIRALLLRKFDKEARTATFVCSTDAIDRYDEIVAQKWRLDAYRKNPVALYAHNQCALPIGQSIQVDVVDNELVATIKFATERANPLAENVWQSILEETLRAVSVGFYPHEVRWEKRDDREVLVLDDNELLEISVVPVPANPEALAKAKARAFDLAKRSAPEVVPAPAPEAPAAASETPAPAPAAEASEPTAPASAAPPSEAPAPAPAADADEVEVVVEDEDDEPPPDGEGDEKASPAADEDEDDEPPPDDEEPAQEAAPRAAAGLSVERQLAKLRSDNAKLVKEKAAAEEALARQQLQPLLGEEVDPWEVKHLLKLRTASPELYEGELKRRQKQAAKQAARNLKQRQLPGDLGAASTAADPAAQVNAALERNKPKD